MSKKKRGNAKGGDEQDEKLYPFEIAAYPRGMIPHLKDKALRRRLKKAWDAMDKDVPLGKGH